jgi:hypothetical protein
MTHSAEQHADLFYEPITVSICQLEGRLLGPDGKPIPDAHHLRMRFIADKFHHAMACALQNISDHGQDPLAFDYRIERDVQSAQFAALEPIFMLLAKRRTK